MRARPWTGRIGIVFTGQHCLEPFLDQLAPGPLDIGDAGVQRRGNPAVAPTFARIRHVRLQENARLRQQLRRTLTFADQLIELGTFLRGQPHYVLLDGDLFPGHESPPSLASGDRDPEVAVIFNDGGDSLVWGDQQNARSGNRGAVRRIRRLRLEHRYTASWSE